MTETDAPPTSFAATFRAMADDLAGVADRLSASARGLDEEWGDCWPDGVSAGLPTDAETVRTVGVTLERLADGLDALDAPPSPRVTTDNPVGTALRRLAEMVRDRDPALAEHWDWVKLERREVGSVDQESGEVFVRIEQLRECPRCQAAVADSKGQAHVRWHRTVEAAA